MNIVMMTNTYKPIVGGLEKSVEVFSDEYRKRGHKVLIVAPEFEGTPKKEEGIFRVPAIQHFNKTDFSVELPLSPQLNSALKKFKPDIIHSHHPFLIGDTALRAAARLNTPIVFTNHTLYEENTHYVPGDSEAMKQFVVKLAKGYANLCDHVIAPSQSVANLLRQREVTAPIDVLPTGIYIDQFKKGDGRTFRKFFDIPKDAFLVGIIGRVAPEKNVLFLSKAVTEFLKKNKSAYFVVVGSGPSMDEIKTSFERNKIEERLVCAGVLKGKQLISAYDSLDVFAFASHSETQGLVLVEAMATGTPVVAVNAPGVREVLKDKINGRMIERDHVQEFVACLDWLASQSAQKKAVLAKNARKTAKEFSVFNCVQKALEIYSSVIKKRRKEHDLQNNPWKKAMHMIKTQVEIMANTSTATASAVASVPKTTLKKVTKKVENIVKQGVD
ncbi:MAG: glycosyltransferase [Candidatus Aceula meridiana]|nr:glycosyltransferase [Candidatus Aceula meridiana]